MVMVVGKRANMGSMEESPSTGPGLRARCPVLSSVETLLTLLDLLKCVFNIIKILILHFLFSSTLTAYGRSDLANNFIDNYNVNQCSALGVGCSCALP